MSQPIRLLIVDDHTIVRQGLRSILELEPGIEVIAEASDGEGALEAVERHRPDIVLLDLSLSGGNNAEGLEVCRVITARYPQIGVIILTTFLEERLVVQAIKSGAKGYVLKDVDAVDLVKNVRAVSRGDSALDTRSASLVMRNLAGAQREETGAHQLSERELVVVRLLARGFSNRAIGAQIAISESTVKFHLRNVMRKLGVHHRTEVVYAASKSGLL
jgi:DNA-binding NarL/FixJ family response regulator